MQWRTYSAPRVNLITPEQLDGFETFAGLPIVVAQGGRVTALGKGSAREQRIGSAVGEWIERVVLFTAVPDIYATVRELGDTCLLPESFGLDIPGDEPAKVLRYDLDCPVGWIRSTDLEGTRRWMHQPGWSESGFYRPTSNGAAVAHSREESLRKAVAELLERHAFVTWWYELDESLPVRPTDAAWSSLREWFESQGWELTAHLLPSTHALPVVLAVAVRRNRSDKAAAAIIGLGNANGMADAIGGAARAAAHEIVQAIEGFEVWRAAGADIGGDLATFLKPSGAGAILRRLNLSADPIASPSASSCCPLQALAEAEARLWIAERHSPLLDVYGLHHIQVFSEDLLPFPSTGRGRRLAHPVLRSRLDERGRTLDSVPPLPHPLG
ncbi:YcaO-like family protein [Aldersonia sp. NBC_00410]|uniref:YcaO-like family protein n=1 Tax=Aldersonia sp. NBC_00410 TaxID=2975954 RepID=UPI0022565CE5|nr:YcaO-like family protein [Aldersonia sp. NBC_00410]MCX5042163.1 YcaO-like family protein [Aldersonia sp. NBC_00410]